MHGDLRVRVLGQFVVRYEGRTVPDVWRLRRARTLVKLLAVAGDHQLRREIVIDTLWPGRDDASAANNLHQTVHAARRTLSAGGAPAEVLHVDGDLIRLDGVRTDLAELVATATGALAIGEAAPGQVIALRSALALHTGDLLPGDPPEPWLLTERERLDALLASTRTALARALLRRGGAADVEESARMLHEVCRSRPYDEAAYRLLLEALERSGRRWDALEAFEALRSTLEADLAARPEPATVDLYRRLLSGSGPGHTRSTLPRATTSFVGRRREARELTALAHRTRLLTLTGTGGAGKTRLALELLRVLSESDPDRDCRVADLSGVRDPALVPGSVASALGLTPTDRHPSAEAVARSLGDRDVLLLLDNCEHLLDAAAAVVGALLRLCPGAWLVATSREPLRLPGESTWRVPSLTLPDAAPPDAASLMASEAVQLLVERTRAVDPHFAITPANARALAHVCRRLDGMPLALELAAARLAHMAPAELADRLDDALTVLTTRLHGVPDRQATLAATLAWSHDLLDADEAAVFRRLAVFAGGFTLEAAEAVASDPAPDARTPAVSDLLSALVEKSLVSVDTTDGAAARYRLLEVVRQYAGARLTDAGETDEMLARHSRWYADRAAGQDPDASPDGVVREPSPWLAVEQENLRVAMATLLRKDPARALGTAVAMGRSLMARGMHLEGSRWLGRALEACPQPTPLRARALFMSAVFETRLGRLGGTGAIGAQIADVGRRVGGPALELGLYEEAVLAWMCGDYDHSDSLTARFTTLVDPASPGRAAGQHLRAVQCLCRADAAAAHRWAAAALRVLEGLPPDTRPFFRVFTPAWASGAHDGLRFPVFEETMLIGTRVGVAQAVAYVLCTLALAERADRRFPEAAASLDRAVRIFRACGDVSGEARAESQRGHLFRDLGDGHRAVERFRSALDLWTSVPDQRGTALALAGHGLAEATRGNVGRARAMAAEACQIVEGSGDLPGLQGVLNNRAVVELLTGRPAQALTLLERSLGMRAVPDNYRSVGWQLVFLSGLRARAGDEVGAAGEARAALAVFRRVGERPPPELRALAGAPGPDAHPR
ncbi:ATP-binding protein [Xylanimonas sp. McL0601]|uniref:ATP-binding protein n=1 Tax=Xylanimonas sp. McL0601 TaxID=3414739 RepID=UPI003CF1714E